ncbi:ankyrin-3 [Trichonephila clavipes]|nr:ankyrin-3 [Trichonephila clavipes]
MEFVREILAKLNHHEDLSSDVIVEKIKQEFETKMGELYAKWDTHEHEYKLCKKEYESWQESGFSLNYEFGGYHTLLRIAAENGYTKIIKTLIEGGINIDGDLKYTPLHQAVNDGCKEMVEFLLENGADINAKTEASGETPLYIAVKKRNIEIIELLIEKGANVNAGDKGKNTPLHYTGDIRIARLLVANGANVNAKNKSDPPYSTGSTPLHGAANAGNKDIAEFLIDNGADINAQNAQGSTPLHKVSGIDTLKLLIERGAKVNIKNGEGFTPLHYMAFMLDEASTLIIVEHGADPWARGDNGETPVDRYVNRLEHAKEEGASGTDEPPGYLMKLKQAYNKDLFVRYSTLLLGAVAAITLFATGNITPDAPRIIGAAALVTAAAFAAGRITYEAFKPSTKMARIEHERFVEAQQLQ